MIHVIDRFDAVTHLKVGPGRYPLPESWQAKLAVCCGGPCHLSSLVATTEDACGKQYESDKKSIPIWSCCKKDRFPKKACGALSTGEALMRMGTDITILHDVYGCFRK